MKLVKQAKWGMWLSGLCAIHCILTPVAVVAMPMIGAELFHNEMAEIAIMGLGFIFSFMAVVKGYWNVHRNFPVLIGVLSGFLLVISGHLIHEHLVQIICSVIGSSLVIFSLYRNNTLLSKCNCNA